MKLRKRLQTLAIGVPLLVGLYLITSGRQLEPLFAETTLAFNVSGSAAWQNTGLDISVGDVVEITASGSIRFDSSGRTADPDGQPDGDLVNCNSLVPTAPSHTLVGRIGASGSLTDETGFLVGSSFNAVATDSGSLFLGFNDCFVKADRSGLDVGGVGDNSGSYTAAVTVSSGGPPEENPHLHYFAAGDSVASGQGLAGDVGDCHLSPNAYPNRVLDLLRSDSAVQEAFLDVSLQSFACGGAVSAGLAPQIDTVIEDIATLDEGDFVVVSVTIGANDFPFSPNPFAGKLLAFQDLMCSPEVAFNASLSALTTEVKDNVATQLRRLLDEPAVLIVVTEYHNPFNTKSIRFNTGGIRGECRPLFRSLSIKGRDAKFDFLWNRTDTVLLALNEALTDAAVDTPTTPEELQRIAVAPIHDAFLTHESPRPTCGKDDPVEADTWVQSRVKVPGTVFKDCYHPNPTGAGKYAESVGNSVISLLFP